MNFPPTFVEQIDAAIQMGRGAAGAVLGQQYDVRRLTPETNVSISGNAPIYTNFPARLRHDVSKPGIENTIFQLLAFTAICNNLYLNVGDQLTEVGFNASESGVYVVGQKRPTRETILLRTEFNASITRPYPTSGAASQMPTTPGGWVEGLGYSGVPKTSEEVLTLANGMYSFEQAGAQMATVFVGLQPTNRIITAHVLKGAPTDLPADRFLFYLPDLPGIQLDRLDRINLGNSDRYEIMSLLNTEDTGIAGYFGFAYLMGV